MATILGSTAGVTFAASSETGILLSSFSANAQADKVEVKNAAGDVVLLSYANQRVSGSVAGTIAGTTGVAAAAIGAALTLANIESVGGVTTGTVVVDSVAISKAPGAFKNITVNFSRYPGI
jgi:hypothetical protein